MKPAWKLIASTVCGMLGSEGAAVVGLNGSRVELHGQLMNVSRGGELISTTIPSAKRISQWLWEQRQKRAFGRAGGAVWAARVNGDIVIGLGAVVDDRTARRARPDTILTPLESVNGA